MKIMSRKSFLKCPPGTLYSEYEPCCFGPLLIKGPSLENDWFCQQINDAIEHSNSDEFIDILHKAERTGEGIPMNFYFEGRDGGYVEDQLFAVWGKKDVESLIKRLSDFSS